MTKDTRKVQQFGPSTSGITLPAEWVRERGVKKGDEIAVQHRGNGTLAVVAWPTQDDSAVTIHAEGLSGDAVERAITVQYVLGQRVIRVTHADGALDDTHIDAVHTAETQLLGVGVVEETPEQIAIRCSVDADDFQLATLLERLERTGRTMRTDAGKLLAYGNPALRQRVVNRERQATTIFMVLLRLIFSAHQNPPIAQAVGLDDEFPLIGYYSIAKNLELTVDNAQHIAELALATAEADATPDPAVVNNIREFTEQVDELMQQSVRAAVERDYDRALAVHTRFDDLAERKAALLDTLSHLPPEDFFQMREVVVCLQQTAEAAMRNAEIAANLAMHDHSEYTTIE